MKKPYALSILLLCLIALSSFTATKKDLLGIWTLAYVQNTQSGEQLDVEGLTMGLATAVRYEFKEDHTYTEYKTTKKENKTSATQGAWKLEEDGAVLEMRVGDKRTPSKIIALSNDTLIVELHAPMQMVLVRAQ